jgi:prepilin signal peptidase PulO-like enzyme (type II secretory pathway)
VLYGLLSAGNTHLNAILDIPMEARLAVLFALGAYVGGLLNLGVYRLAWHRRSIGPWSRPDDGAPARCWSDFLPVVGWLGLRREAALHGRGFWIRPMLVELLCGAGFAALYWWEIGQRGLYPPEMRGASSSELVLWSHAQFAVHLMLMSLMLVASLIDVDEKNIPDAITVPGTLAGLLLAAAFPWSLLPDVFPISAGPIIVNYQWQFTRLTTPAPWPAALGGFPLVGSLILGLACWWAWCLALLPRSWYARHGWRRAMQLCWARIVRHRVTYWILAMGLVGSAVVAAVWYRGDDERWIALLSALVGMAAGGGMIWAVRLVGTAVLKREAMGFGDVTLMAMIGAFLGWQPCVMVFFLAPLAGLVIGVLQWIVLRDNEIPYGPFLCLAAAAVVVFWARVWDWAAGYFGLVFQLGWIMPALLAGCFALMALLLWLIGRIRGAFARRT